MKLRERARKFVRMSVPLAFVGVLSASSLPGYLGGEGWTEQEPPGRRLISDLGCPACHEIRGHATTIQAEAPDLTAAGEKMRPEWLFTFLKQPHSLRPWLRGRMPDFRLTDEESLAITEYLQALGAPVVAVASGSSPGRATPDSLAAGARLVSKDYFDCLNCHQQGDKKPEGSPDGWAPDFTLARARLRPDWVIRWLQDPQKLQPGTKMPAYFPGGPPDVLGGDAAKQILALKDYILSLGPDAIGAYAEAKEKYPHVTVALGEKLVVAFNCAGCHKIGSLARTLRPGPVLSWEGSKVREQWLLGFLEQPTLLRPQGEARMPSFRLSNAEAVALVSYIRETLTTLEVSRTVFRSGEVTGALIAEGKRLFEVELGCRTCHRVDKEGAFGGPELTSVASRLEEGWLFHWIRDPKRFDPHAPMPKVGITDDEAKAVTAYLAHRRSAPTAAGSTGVK